MSESAIKRFTQGGPVAPPTEYATGPELELSATEASGTEPATTAVAGKAVSPAGLFTWLRKALTLPFTWNAKQSFNGGIFSDDYAGTGNRIMGTNAAGDLYATPLNADNPFAAEPAMTVNVTGNRGEILSFDVDVAGNRYFVAIGNNIIVRSMWDDTEIKTIPVGAPINAMAYIPGNTLVCYSYLLATSLTIDITTNAQTIIGFPIPAVHFLYNASNNTVYGGDVGIRSYNMGTGVTATIVANGNAALHMCADRPGSPYYYVTTSANVVQRRRISDNTVVASSTSIGSPLNPLFVEKESGMLYLAGLADDYLYDAITLVQLFKLPRKVNPFAYVRGYPESSGMARNTTSSALTASTLRNFRVK